jgi:protoporphyrinogen oxidase
VKWAYPVYDIHYQENINTVLDALESISNLYSIGRQGGFNYVGQMDCLDMGIRTAEYILTHSDKSAWKEVRESFQHYIVLD